MKKLVYGMMALAALASCNSDDDMTVSVPRSNMALNFSLNAAETKAIVESTTFPVGQTIGIYGFDARTSTIGTVGWGNAAGYTQDLANGVYTTQALNGSGVQYLKPADGKIAYFQKGDDAAVVLYGYYPYTAEASSVYGDAAPTIPVEGKAAYDTTDDYMYTGRIEQPVTYSTIPLVFKHAMGGLKLKLKCADETVGDVTVLKATVVTKKGQKGTMNVADGTITYDEDLSTAVTTFASPDLNVPVAATSAGEDLGVKFLFLPGLDVIEKVIITLNRGSFPANDPRTYEITAAAEGAHAVNLVAGKFTILNLVFSPKDMNFTAEIAEWTDNAEENPEFSETDKYTE